MENQEEKKACCQNLNNCHSESSSCCGHRKHCRMLKLFVGIIIIVIAFCLGSQWGEMRNDFRYNRFEKSRMMDWNSDRLEKRIRPIKDEVNTPIVPDTNSVE